MYLLWAVTEVESKQMVFFACFFCLPILAAFSTYRISHQFCTWIAQLLLCEQFSIKNDRKYEEAKKAVISLDILYSAHVWCTDWNRHLLFTYICTDVHSCVVGSVMFRSACLPFLTYPFPSPPYNPFPSPKSQSFSPPSHPLPESEV